MTDFMINYMRALVMLTADMAPYLLFGFFVSGLLKVAIPSNMLSRYMGKNNLSSVINAGLLGIPLPLCSCGVLPAGISLNKNGASKGASVSFLISTPQTGVDSILVTYSMLGFPFALLRPVAAMFTGVMGGIFTNKWDKDKVQGVKKEPEGKAVGNKFSFYHLFHYAFIEMVGDIAKWLVIGLLLAAFITVLIPDNFFNNFAINGIVGMLVILAVSIPLYVCATASVPIAAVLLMKGLSPGAMLVFLMAGPATNAATMTVIGNNLGKKTLVIYLVTLIVGSMAFGLLIDYFLPVTWFSPIMQMGAEHQHELLPAWLSNGSAIVLAGFIIYSFIVKIRFNKNIHMNHNKDASGMPYVVLSVEGMTCNHCKANVENGVTGLNNVAQVEADVEKNIVTVYGNNLDVDDIGRAINELNYNYKGRIEG